MAPSPALLGTTACPRPTKLKPICLAGAILAAMAGCSSDTPARPTPNRPPTANLTAAPTITVAQVMSVLFTATANDPDGDPLTFHWNFGDGTSAGGAMSNHLYRSPGTYAVTLTVSDGRSSGTATTTVISRNLDALWLEAVAFPEGTYGVEITQQGDRFTGRVISPFAQATGPLTGTISSTGAVTYEATYVGFDYRESFTGHIDSTVTRMTGTIRASNGLVYNPTLVRQP
jgi:PKD repeat protein